MKSKYITADDWKEYWGKDLGAELKTDDNPSNEVDAFLYRVEKRMEAFLNANFYKNIEQEYPKFSDYQKEHYKIALLEQSMYILTQGDISLDSGYEQAEGIKATREQLHKIKMCDNAREELMLCGLWSGKIKTRSRGGLDGWWMY
jgi:hypothetical protein